MNLGCFRNERKPMLGLFLKYLETNEIELLSQRAKANVRIVPKFQKSMNLSCFHNEQKTMLGLVLK